MLTPRVKHDGFDELGVHARWCGAEMRGCAQSKWMYACLNQELDVGLDECGSTGVNGR